MEILLFLAGIALFIIGLTFIIGLGWLTVIMDFIGALDGTQAQPSGNYSKIQKEWSTKKIEYKLLGFALMGIGVWLILQIF